MSFPAVMTTEPVPFEVLGKAFAMPLQETRIAPPVGPVNENVARIVRPQAMGRWLLPSVAAITPQYVEAVLRGALAGDHTRQWELFDLMEDTWPRLRKNVLQVKNVLRGLKPRLEAWCEEEEDPTDSAKERQGVVSAALRRMRPNAAADENTFGGLVFDLADACFKGVSVLETEWHRVNAGKHGDILAPRTSYWVHPTCYSWNSEGRLGLRTGPAATAGTSIVQDFVPDKFLVAICKTKSGTPLGGALLRALAWWWCAANFSADWLLNLAQIFGLPFRWANYQPNAPQATIDAICSMLQNMGSAGWAAFPAGTTMELKAEGMKGGGQTPQGDMLDRADKQADLLILGQTLTSDTGGMGSGGGSKALGEVHEGVMNVNVNAYRAFVEEVISTQLVPAILRLNYGDDDECPEFELGGEEEEEDLTKLATVLKTLVDSGAGERIPAAWVNKKFGIPAPADGEATLKKAALVLPVPGAPGADPALPAKPAPAPGEPAPEKSLEEKLAAACALQDDHHFLKALHALIP